MFTLIIAIVCIILGVILRVYDDFPGIDLGCVCIGLMLLIVYLFSDVPIHHEYIDCPECNEKIQLSDDFYFGY